MWQEVAGSSFRESGASGRRKLPRTLSTKRGAGTRVKHVSKSSVVGYSVPSVPHKNSKQTLGKVQEWEQDLFKKVE